MSGGNVPRIALWIISEFKLNDHLKIDGRKVDVLLLGLRDDYYLHQKFKPPSGGFCFWWNEVARLLFTARSATSLKKRSFFFTSSQNLRSLACEVVQRQGLCLAFLRLNSLSLHL
jgi:hypothetical protein